MTKTAYTADQTKEIEDGRAQGLDVSIYEKPEYLAIQMREIRLGLEKELPVKYYARPEFDWFQMQEIRKGLEHGVDVTKYARVEIPFETMRQIRKGLQEGIDLSNRTKMPAGILRQLRHAAASGVDISKYVAEGYDEEQLMQIRLALQNGITNIDEYISPCLRGVSIRQIRLGLEEKIDVSLYAGDEMNWQQMREVRYGLDKRLDVTPYLNPLYSWEQMREIRLGIEEGFPIEQYSSFMYTASQMKERRLTLAKGERLQGLENTVSSKYSDFELFVDNEKMEATIFLHDKGKQVDRNDLLQAFQQNGIKRGIDFEVMDKICDGSCEGDVYVIARGKQPTAGKDGWYEFFFDTDLKNNPILLKDGSVDYQNAKWFEMVKQGQKVAFYHMAEEGTGGYRINGEILPPMKGKEKRVLTGQNFMLLQDHQTYVSAIDGKVELHDDRLIITSLLVVDDITLANGGNVTFNGSLYVRGDVGRGTHICVTGDVLVNGFTEGAVIEAGGDIILRKGNNADGRGFVKAGGDVLGVFFEAANVMAGQNIKANYCMISMLRAGGNIEVSGKNGVLVGGDAYAGVQVRAFHLGNAMGLNTRICLGEKSALDMEAMRLAEQESRVKNELRLLKNAFWDMRQKYPEEIRNANPVYLKLEDAIYTKEAEADNIEKKKKDIEKRKKKKKDCNIIAMGTIHPGVFVEINGLTWQSKELQNVVLREGNGYIRIESNSFGK